MEEDSMEEDSVVGKGFSASRIDGHCGGTPVWLDVQFIAKGEAMAGKIESESLPFLVVETRHEIARVGGYESGRGSGRQQGGKDAEGVFMVVFRGNAGHVGHRGMHLVEVAAV